MATILLIILILLLFKFSMNILRSGSFDRLERISTDMLILVQESGNPKNEHVNKIIEGQEYILDNKGILDIEVMILVSNQLSKEIKKVDANKKIAELRSTVPQNILDLSDKFEIEMRRNIRIGSLSNYKFIGAVFLKVILVLGYSFIKMSRESIKSQIETYKNLHDFDIEMLSLPKYRNKVLEHNYA